MDSGRTLADLRDIRVPSALPGDVLPTQLDFGQLWIVALFALLAAAWAWRRRSRIVSWRKLRQIEVAWQAGRDPVRLAADLAALVRIVLGRRDPLALALTGRAWVERLVGNGFDPSVAAQLSTLPYRDRHGASMAVAEGTALITTVRRWALSH